MEDKDVVIALLAFMTGAGLVWFILRKRKSLTTIARDERGYIIEIMEQVV